MAHSQNSVKLKQISNVVQSTLVLCSYEMNYAYLSNPSTKAR